MNAAWQAQEPSAKNLATAAVQTPPPLVRQFALLATAPGGVARLRELILTLAVQGKLVRQDPSDEPASVLLEKIRAEKERLIAAGKIRRDKQLPAFRDEEQSIEMPKGWELTRLGKLIELISGQHLGPTEYAEGASLDIPYLTGPAEFGIESPEPTRSTTERRAVAVRDDILVTVKGSGVGKLNVVSQPEIAISRQLMAIRPIGVNGKYLFIVLRTLGVKFQQQSIGIAIPGIGREEVAFSVLGLPPLAEQARIVTRVEELMRLCDALESQRQFETAQHAQLLNTLLGTLTDSASAEELAANWQRVSDHFDLLLDRPEAVDALEQTILQLAVRGLLVRQDPNDEPASVLLEKIRAEKDRLIAEGKIKRDKEPPEIAEEEQPFVLPEGWACARFPDLSVITGGSTPSKAVSEYWAGSIPWVSPKDMKVVLITDAQDHVSDSALRGSLSLISPGSLLMVVRGMILVHSFPVAQTAVPVTINQDMKALTPLVPEVLPYLMLICQGMKPEILGLVDRSTHGTCKMESPKIFSLVFPVPPLAEQTRIVSRVTQLRSLCADLRQRLSARQTTQSHLAEALVEV